MMKFNLLKKSVKEIKEKRVYNINIEQIPDMDDYLKTIVEKWKRAMVELPSDFKLPDIPNMNYDITYREDI